MEYLRIAGIILSIAGLIVYALLAIRHPKSRLYLIAPVSWLLFVLLFQAATIGYNLGCWTIGVEVLNVWSQSIRLYALVLVVGVGAVWLLNPTGELPQWFPDIRIGRP